MITTSLGAKRIEGTDNWRGIFDAHNDSVTAHEEAIANKLATANVYNGLDKTAAGYALDARQGKALNDALSTHKSSGDHDGRYYTESEVDTKITATQKRILKGSTTTISSNITKTIPLTGLTQDYHCISFGVSTGENNPYADITVAPGTNAYTVVSANYYGPEFQITPVFVLPA